MTKPKEPKIRWNQDYTPKSVNLGELLKKSPEAPRPGPDALPPPVVYLDDDGKAVIVPAK